MKRSDYMAGRLREVLLDGRWIANTNFKDQLLKVNREQGTQKVGNLNTIAALTFHINYYLDGLLHALDSGVLTISDRYSFDCPEIGSEEDWNVLVGSFLSNAEQFVKRINQLDEEQWEKPFVDEKYGTYLRNIEGVIEHSYYHLGQITLIRKLVG